jgi:hypothetical protein
MTSRIRKTGLVAALALSAVFSLGCGDEGTYAQAAVPGEEDAASQLSALRGRRHHAVTGGSAASGSATTGGGATSSGAGSGGNDPTLADVIAAAQTPDGRAIPQDVGADGQCPDVVRLLGFWSCLNIQTQCSFQADGVTHSCTCLPTSGEGQYPSWSCN